MNKIFGVEDGFDLFFLAFQGFFQFGFALGGAVFLLLGLAIIYDHFNWRSGASKYRTHGDIIGVRVDGHIIDIEEDKEKEAEKLEALKQSTPHISESFFTKFFGNTLGLLFILVILGLPIVFIGIGVHQAYEYYDLQKHGRTASAQVIEYKSYHNTDGGQTYNAVYQYRDHTGRLRQERDRIGTNKPKHVVGTPLTIRYDPRQPSRFQLDDFWHNMGIAIAFISIGSIFMFFIFGGGNMIAERIRKSKDTTRTQIKDTHSKQELKKSYAGEMYSEVIEYVSDRGIRYQAETGGSSSSLRNKTPGMRVPIIASHDDPSQVRRLTHTWLWVALLVLIAPSLIMLTIAFKDGINPIFVAIVLFTLLKYLPKLYKAWREYQALPPEGKEAKKEEMKFKREEKKEANKDKPLLGKYDVEDRVRFYSAQARLSSLFLFLIALTMLTISYYVANDFIVEIYNNPRILLDINWTKMHDDERLSLILSGVGLFLSALCVQSYLASRIKRR
jgi:hypothetical protein